MSNNLLIYQFSRVSPAYFVARRKDKRKIDSFFSDLIFVFNNFQFSFFAFAAFYGSFLGKNVAMNNRCFNRMEWIGYAGRTNSANCSITYIAQQRRKKRIKWFLRFSTFKVVWNPKNIYKNYDKWSF